MSALGILARLLSAVPALIETLNAAARKRISRRPPATRIEMPDTSPIYKDEHCFSRESPTEPPPYCYYCKQLKAQASRYCPGMPPRELG